MSDTFYQVVGCIGFAVLIAAIIAGQRVFAGFQNRAMARALTPLAARISATVDHPNPHAAPAIAARYQGRELRAFPSPGTSAGYGDTALTINAFCITIANVSGRQGWIARFHVTGMLGQGARELQLEIPDRALGERLVAAGLLEALQRHCAGTADYAAAAYDARARTLTVTDDVMPEVLPTVGHFLRHVQLAVQVAQLNELHNSL